MTASKIKDPAAAPEASTILVVDDTPDNLTVLAAVLREHGYDVRPVRNGRTALQAARREPPDLVLLDVLMPEMDGYEVCRQFKADETLRGIPVIFISAATDTDVKIKAFTTGGVDFIGKPFAAAEVLARVRTHLTLRSVERELERRLHEHEERYKVMFDGCKVPELLIDPANGRILDANRAAERYYGWQKARLTAMNIAEINILSEEEVAAEMDLARAGRRNHFHFRHRLASGEIRDVEVYSGVLTVDDRPLLYSLIHDVSERRRAEAALARNRELLNCISRMQSRFIGDTDVHAVFEAALADILKLTGSRIGFLAELIEEPDGTRYQQNLAFSGIEGDGPYARYAGQFALSELKFTSFECLYAASIVTCAPVIANDPASHPSSCGTPDGHPSLECFLGLPICRGDAVIGSIGLANRDGGYDAEIAAFIQPAIAAVAQILDAHREQQQRQQAVQALSESESRYRSLVDTQVDMVVRFNSEGQITFINNTVCTKLELPHTELIGQPWTCLVDPEDRSDMADSLEAASVYHSYSGVVETRFRGRSGARWYSWEVGAITNADQTLNEIQAIGRDITELKVAQEDLRLSQERLALATASAHIGVWDYDPTTTAAVWDEEMLRLYGLDGGVSPSYAIWRTCLHPEDRERAERDIAMTLAGLPHLDTEFRIVRPDGEVRHIKSGGQVFRDAAGKPVRMVGINYDITERKRFEQELEELLDLTQKIITQSPVGIAVYRACGPCVLANVAYADILGGTLDGVQGGNFRDLGIWKENGFLALALKALESGQPLEGSAHHVTPSGREVWVDVHFLPISRKGERHLLCIKNDVSSWHQAEQVLREAKQAAEQASRAKSAFVANMSHEIRTPMNAILGLLYLLDQTELTMTQRDYVTKTSVSAQSLLRILNDILDFSKVEADRLDLETVPFRLDEVMKTLATVAGASAQDKDIEVLFRIAPETPLSLVGDPLRLQQVLMNLASNAIKFTPRGEVVLSVMPGPIAADAVTLIFEMRDTGIGIASDLRQYIFDAFSQADSGTSRCYGGSGLGLAISKRLATLMGGEITVDSVLGHGSTFRFTARFSRGPQGVPPTPPDLPRSPRLLVVDDHPTAREVLTAMIAPMGWQMVVAASGREAMAAIDRSLAGRAPFDLILLDWQMPDVTGRDVLRHARYRYRSDAVPAILVVTAFENERVRRDAGDDPLVKAILVKPVTPWVLYETVAHACSHSEAEATVQRPARETVKPLAGLSLLVVEDNKINQMIARRILESTGARVQVAASGAEAVRVLTGAPARFDAVLMDIQMPDMDGYETTRRIRTQLGLSVPVIAMTANALPTDRESCFVAGMNDHVGKPLDIDLLLSTILRWTKGLSPKEPTPSASAANHGLPVFPELDLAAGLRRTSGNIDLLKEIMADFLSQHVGKAEALSRALAAGDHATIAHISHDLLTLAANIGAMRLSGAAAALQSAARHHDPDQLAPRTDEVVRRLEVTLHSIEACLGSLAGGADGAEGG